MPCLRLLPSPSAHAVPVAPSPALPPPRLLYPRLHRSAAAAARSCVSSAPATPSSLGHCCSVLSSMQEDGSVASHRSNGLGTRAPPGGPSMLVFSGGTALNGVVEELKKLTSCVTHVLPVSDDGGSTSEIVRVLGGPAIGDIRSRCLRLSDESTAEALAVKCLLGYRLPLNAEQAKPEWYEIVEGSHPLWEGVSVPYRETIRAFLVYFQSQILHRSREKFSFGNGSIGNFFFAGTRLFFQSLDAAIFLFSRVSHIPIDSFVLPAISTNERLTLGCELHDGTIIRGQNAISHPVNRDSAHRLPQFVSKGTQSSCRLPSPIKHIFYMSSEGTNLLHEVFPAVNPNVLEHLNQVEAIVYGMGSLYTSICPSLVLGGVGELIAKRTCPKVLLLNGSHDRETFGMTASDFVVSISNALNRKHLGSEKHVNNLPAAYVNVMLMPRGGDIPIDASKLDALGISHVVTVDSVYDERVGIIFEPKSLINALKNAIGTYLP